MFDNLQHVLFPKLTEKQHDISEEIASLKKEQRPEIRKERLEAFFDEKLEYLRENFPTLFGPALAGAIKHQIKESQDEVIEALYPIMGKLIRKYVKTELEQITQRIDQQLNDALTFDKLWLRVRAFFSGVSYEEIIIRRAAPITLEEIFVVEIGSGLLYGQYSFNQLLNADMIAGMLTGIKEFVEHALGKDEQQLETINYENYDILLYNYPGYYVACVIQGIPHAIFKAKLAEKVDTFCASQQILSKQDFTQANKDVINAALNQHFNGFNQEDKQKDSATGKSRSREDLLDQ